MSNWVTGANGFIGRHLVRELAGAGHAVHGVGHGALDPAQARALGLQTWINGEVDAANLNALAALHGLPSQVFHLAGGSSVGLSIARPFEDFSRTVTSTARLLEWLRSFAPNCLLVVASSAAVYGIGQAGPIPEDAPLTPMSPYGEHKLMMEQMCRSYARSYGLGCVIVRLFSVYGPNLRKQLLWDICSRLKDGEPALTLGGTGAEIRDWTDVRDVARLLARAGEFSQQRAVHIINGGSGLGTSVAAIAASLVRHWGGSTSVGYSGVARPGDPTSLLANPGRLHEIGFDWRIPLDHGLADYVSWFREQAR
ncbi:MULTISPECIES: NAD(P)-dependent oxidoreductase [unclassified Bradyrhizobium]|uniref:NAD-dependent epimerase/dehydratase family protein n=1 Tax=unclassified Bradyrhizobium TaxID=2631580 RepID=UPI001FF923D2|nr:MULTISPECIES: NAD(P)-dependent oxidoreductase [unclassified Bradyrhizobium]MCK1551532.1 NAD(P)-dependent oxidoreductase [Bradyrhizobium sp. 177]MCK1569987.1 NAD(P)-dependent oxidoreductase [Bradyrhizobium sp. 173]MCK1577679.1 NAD(P)-dependent oxidoreductase [Bradyrhizobium sp. 174]